MSALRKVIFWFAAVSFVMVFVLFISNLFLNRLGFTKEAFHKIPAFDSVKEVNWD